jgi:hypothetical protein
MRQSFMKLSNAIIGCLLASSVLAQQVQLSPEERAKMHQAFMDRLQKLEEESRHKPHPEPPPGWKPMRPPELEPKI